MGRGSVCYTFFYLLVVDDYFGIPFIKDPLSGIIPRSLHQLFEQLEAQVGDCTCKGLAMLHVWFMT